NFACAASRDVSRSESAWMSRQDDYFTTLAREPIGKQGTQKPFAPSQHYPFALHMFVLRHVVEAAKRARFTLFVRFPVPHAASAPAILTEEPNALSQRKADYSND